MAHQTLVNKGGGIGTFSITRAENGDIQVNTNTQEGFYPKKYSANRLKTELRITPSGEGVHLWKQVDPYRELLKAEKRVFTDSQLYVKLNALYTNEVRQDALTENKGWLSENAIEDLLDLNKAIQKVKPKVRKGVALYAQQDVMPRALHGETRHGDLRHEASITMDPNGTLHLYTGPHSLFTGDDTPHYDYNVTIPPKGPITIAKKKEEQTITHTKDDLYAIVRPMYEQLCSYDEHHELKGNLAKAGVEAVYRLVSDICTHGKASSADVTTGAERGR